MRGIVLDPSNFTPLERTPWAGDQIWKQLKSHLIGVKEQQKIGESWEFSLDENFPSKLKGGKEKLSEYLKKHGHSFLGEATFAITNGYIDVLVKIIQAERPLSLQVHPDDQYAKLLPNECGKPESWLILDALPGAGVYLGFSRSVSKSELEAKLKSHEDIRELLQFVPVKRGDYFELGPGVPHALGAGVLVFEPQIVQQGKSGKTYRLWDWGMRYDASGEPSEGGQPRPLHLNESLELIEPQRQFGMAFVESVSRKFKEHTLSNGMRVFEYPSNGAYQVFWMSAKGGKNQKLTVQNGYCVAFVVDGSVQVTYEAEASQDLLRGETIFFGENCFPANLNLNGDLCFVVNAGARVNWL